MLLAVFRRQMAIVTISTMLNERDGGIGGVPIKVVECETAVQHGKRR